MKIECAHCGKKTEKYVGHVNRAKKLGLNVYCGRKCAGLGRRRTATVEELKREKYFYDAFLHLADPEKKRKAAKEYFQKDYAANPEKYKQFRIAQRENHRRHCSTPEYKAYKHKYDVERHHKAMYGEFWEASILLNELETFIDNRQAKQQAGLIGKSQKRKRQWQKIQAKTTLASLLKT